MNRNIAMVGLLLAAGCSSSSSPGSASGDDASGDGSMVGTDATTPSGEGGNPEASSPETSTPEASSPETGTPETGGGDAGNADGSTDAPTTADASDSGGADADAAAVDAACSGAWLTAPTVAALALPDGGVVLLHAAGAGTQDYACVGTPVDAGTDGGDAGEAYAWTLTGPDAVLSDCNGNPIGHHFPSEAGAAAPEWQTVDGTYVVGRKLVSYTPDGGSASVPWLLLQATSHGGTGTLSNVTYVQRLDTDGGVAPATGCDQGTAGATQNVSYTADYYFFGP